MAKFNNPPKLATTRAKRSGADTPPVRRVRVFTWEVADIEYETLEESVQVASVRASRNPGKRIIIECNDGLRVGTVSYYKSGGNTRLEVSHFKFDNVTLAEKYLAHVRWSNAATTGDGTGSMSQFIGYILENK